MNKIIIFSFSFILLLSNCKKEKITKHSIKGIVYNECTNKGLQGVTVYLNDNHGLNTSIVTDINGGFIFEDIETNSLKNNYNYNLLVPSQSGIGSTNKENCRFDGDQINFSLSDIEKEFQLNVIPGFLNLCYSTNILFPIIQPDSIYITFEQKIIKNKFPNIPASGKISNSSTINSCTANYPMGWWYFTTKKWKSGIYSSYLDSLYLDWGGTNTYTINW